MWTLFLCLASLQGVSSLIAYDCGHDRINRTRISTISIESCNFEFPDVSQETDDIQLLEMADVASVHIYQCKINVQQSVFFCGMFSHLSLAAGGLSSFIADVSQDECMQIQKRGIYRLPNGKYLQNIKPNATSRYTETVRGSVDSKGNCAGTSFSYGTSSWDNVIVIHAMELTITDYLGKVRLEDNQVILRSKVLCPYLHGKCTDPEYGMSFWDMIPNTSCEVLEYAVLYEGNATKIQSFDVNHNRTRVIYTVKTGDVTFALEVLKPTKVCSYDGFQTEHPRLIVVKRTTSNSVFKTKSSKNPDLFTYINSKFVYVERHIKEQIENLYAHLMHKKCEVERSVLETQLAVAHHHPAEFAFMRMKEPGYTAVSRGEVIYLIKCQAVEVTVRKTDRCYNELPVMYNNGSYFMAPSSHLLQEYGTEIPCSTFLSPVYLLHGTWFGFSPQSHKLEAPGTLHPTKDILWHYEETHDLIKSGIYNYEEMDELRRQIMYSSERKAIENVLTKTLLGHDMDQQNVNVLHLFSSKSMSTLSQYLQKGWSFFSQLGNLSATALGFWMFIRLCKTITTFAINFRIIQKAYGWSWWLLAAVWNSLTLYLIYRRKQQDLDVNLTSVSVHDQEGQSTESGTSEQVEATSNPITLNTLRQNTTLYPSLQIRN